MIACTAAEAGYYGYVVAKFGGPFIEMANVTPLSGWLSFSFAATAGLLGMCAVAAFVWGMMFAITSDEMKRRMTE